MKLKIWAFVLIVVGAVLLGGLGGFALSQGVSLAGNVLAGLKAIRAAEAPRIAPRLPADPPFGGNNPGGMAPWSRGGRHNPGFRFGGGNTQDALPPGFNAGVSIPGTYGAMTGRTEQQVLDAANESHTDTWGLAAKEGKLDELKEKVQSAVTESLDKMVAGGTITAAQKDAYLKRVKLILQSAGAPDANSGTTAPDGGATQKPAA